MLCALGDLLEDVVVRLAAPPARGTDTPAVVTRSRGGSAANVAVAAAASGCPTRFIGRVGQDVLGDQLAAGLAATGVEVRVQRAGRTGCVVVLVEPDGERTMLPDRGAAIELGPVEPSWLDGLRWAHVPAYSLYAEPIGTAAVAVVRALCALGTPWSLDVSSVAVVEAFGPDRFAAIVDALSPAVVFANADEAPLLHGLSGPVPLLVVKDGPRPVRLRHADGRLDTVAVEPIAGVADTTGVGDAFAGGFLAATLAGADPVAAARAGVALAARTLRSAGAGLSSR